MNALVVLGVGMLLGTGTGRAGESALVLPKPPEQGQPWTAPASLCSNLLALAETQPADRPNRTNARPMFTHLLSAADTLFEQGFPDPRGCEYREIEVVVSSIWGGQPRRVTTRGWVLPTPAGATQQFAICWNGLVYPLERVGAPADLHAELAGLPRPPRWSVESGVGENQTVFSTNAPSTRVLLQLRAGAPEAALQFFIPDEELHRLVRAFPWRTNGSRNPASFDPYLLIAADWAWALFDRTLCAHMRGDNALALATARTLAEVRPKIEAEAARRGFQRREYHDGTKRGQEKPYLDFLEQFPELLADLERRAREGHRVSIVKRGLTNQTSPTARIRALIRDLDLVQARQWGQPGWVDLPGDPIVAALIREGDAAVEPLLHCMETDQRLTRSVGFYRDFSRQRQVIPVSSAARAAVRTILQVNFRTDAEARAYWRKFGGLKREERWYATLKDNTAGLARWQEAAANITRPGTELAARGADLQMKTPPSTNRPVRLQGEGLRGKSRPSVSELLARRAREVTVHGPQASYDLALACEIGLCLATWEAPAAGPVARTLVHRCRTVMEYSPERNTWPVQRLGSFIGKLTLARVQAGDPEALVDYAAWLQTVTPERLDTYLADSLQPLRVFPTNTVLQATADALFSPTNAAWGTLPWKGNPLFNPIETELVNIPAFRRLLARELENTELCGSATWHAPNRLGFEIKKIGLLGGRLLALPEAERPPEGARAELRWCDWIALGLAQHQQMPAFNPFAPVEQRDAAIRNAREKLLAP